MKGISPPLGGLGGKKEGAETKGPDCNRAELRARIATGQTNRGDYKSAPTTAS